MKRTGTILLLAVFLWQGCTTQQGGLLPNYNNSFYPSVIQAAQGVAEPFLLQQKYDTMQYVTVENDSFLVYNKVRYAIHDLYQNPPDSGYFLDSINYQAFGIPVPNSVWPHRMPYALYNAADTTFNSTIDCVGYGTRLLSATGSANPDSNAYIQLINTVHRINRSPFAGVGTVATAYGIAVAFPLLDTTATKGWKYVAGNVQTAIIDALNRKDTGLRLLPYTGQPKGGFANAQPGDILSFGYAPGEKSNGHFMVIEKAPIYLDSAALFAYFQPFQQQFIQSLDSLLNAYSIYAVPLFDCSGQNVHFDDSRKYTSGIGHGTLLMLTDKAQDIPQGFIFSPPHLISSNSTTAKYGVNKMSDSTLAITVGRYIP